MIRVKNVSKRYRTRSGWKNVLKNVNFELNKGEKIGILGRNGAGKSTLIRLISGVESPSSGTIERKMSISWPLAFSGAFQGSLTGMDNLRFISRIYNADVDYVHQFAQEFSELGDYLYEPVRKYSSGMKARLAFALSLSVEFDCYLIDEVIAVGDSRFSDKCRYELFEKRQDRSIILVSHSVSAMESYCDNAVVLEDGIMHHFDDMQAAYRHYDNIQEVAPEDATEEEKLLFQVQHYVVATAPLFDERREAFRLWVHRNTISVVEYYLGDHNYTLEFHCTDEGIRVMMFSRSGLSLKAFIKAKHPELLESGIKVEYRLLKSQDEAQIAALVQQSFQFFIEQAHALERASAEFFQSH